MKKSIKLMITSVFAVAGIFSASLRADDQSLDRAPASRGQLSDHQRELTQGAVFDLWVQRYNQVKSVDEFERVYVAHMPLKANRNYFHQVLKQIDRLPKLTSDQFGLIATADGREFRIEIPHYNKPIIKVGQVQWTFNPQRPLKPQIELLQKKLQLPASSTDALLELLLPAAHAGVGSVAVGAVEFFKHPVPGMFLAFFLSSFGLPITCSIASALDKDWSICWEYFNHEAEIRAKHLGKIAKVEGMDKKEETQRRLIGWFTNDDLTCPILMDRSKSTFVIDMRETKPSADGKDLELNGDWFTVVENYNGGGKPVKFVITAKGTNTNEPNWLDKATNVLTFKDGLLYSIQYQNPHYDPSKVGSRFLEQLVTDDKTDEEKARTKLMSELVSSLDETTKRCQEAALAKKLKEKDGLQNSNPSKQLEEGVTLPGAPAPDAVTK